MGTESNRGTTSWVAPAVLAELIGRANPIVLTAWEPAGWLGGRMESPTVAVLDFTLPEAGSWELQARLAPGAVVCHVEVDGLGAPFESEGEELRVTATVEGAFEVRVIFEGDPACPPPGGTGWTFQ